MSQLANFILVYYLCSMLVHDHVGLSSTAQAKPSNVLPICHTTCGSDHDAIVKEWRGTLLASINSRNSKGEVIVNAQYIAIYGYIQYLSYMYVW